MNEYNLIMDGSCLLPATVQPTSNTLNTRFHGPQTGSRASTPDSDRRACVLPSRLTVPSIPCSPCTVAYNTAWPFGAKLGDSSRAVSVSTRVCPEASSCKVALNRPPSRLMQARYRPSGLIAGETL